MHLTRNLKKTTYLCILLRALNYLIMLTLYFNAITVFSIPHCPDHCQRGKGRSHLPSKHLHLILFVPYGTYIYRVAHPSQVLCILDSK